MLIEIPENIDETLNDYYQPKGDDESDKPETPLKKCLTEYQLSLRREAFSEELVATCYDFYAEQHLNGEFDDTQSIRDWPVTFDVNDVPEIEERPLKDKPEIKHT